SPLAHPVLYLNEGIRDASPKAISGRTSYLRVRLAFHLYPQLISQLFNVEEFGPPQSVTSASAWPWVAHAVSGLVRATAGLAPDALFRLAVASASAVRP